MEIDYSKLLAPYRTDEYRTCMKCKVVDHNGVDAEDEFGGWLCRPHYDQICDMINEFLDGKKDNK